MALFKKKNSTAAKKNADRTTRLLSDYKRITELFKAHKHISIKEVFGAPPERYHFLYQIDGLVKAGNAIEVKNEHVVEIELPAGYPASAPVCRRITSIFHPNISDEGIDIQKYWTPPGSLADLVVRIGEMISFQKYDTENPVAADAAKWADRNAGMLPLSSIDLRYSESEPQGGVAAEVSPVVAETREPYGAGPLDSRKTEGFTIETGSDHISIEDESVTPAPQNADLRKTALLEEEKADTVAIIPDESGPEATHTIEAAPSVAATPPGIQLVGEEGTEPVRRTEPAAAAEPVPISTPAIFPRAGETRGEEEPFPDSRGTGAKPQTSESAPAPSVAKKFPRITAPSHDPVLPKSEPPLAPSNFPEKDRPTELSAPALGRDTPVDETREEARTSMQEKIIHCSECGRSNARIANFCSTCGSRLLKPGSYAKVSTSRILLLSFLVSAPVAILAVGAAIVFTRQILPIPSRATQAAVVSPAPAAALAPAAAKVPQKPVPSAPVVPNTAAARKIVVEPAPKHHRINTITAEQKQARIKEALQIAHTYLDLESYDAAESKYMDVLKMDPNNDDALDGLRMVREARDNAADEEAKKK